MSNSDDWGVRLIKLLHFERLQPLCPRCMRDMGRSVPLELRSVLQQDRDSIIEGVLVCTNRECLSEYPIIDGIPIIVADLRSYVSQNAIPILRRHDFTDIMESVLGDCFGPSSAFDTQRYSLSTYCFDHYGDLDPEGSNNSSGSPGSVLKLLKQGLSGIQDKRSGPVIDIGCAVGRTTFELAEAVDDIVLGVDLNFDMLKTAASVLANGQVVYPRRRVGIVYDRRKFPAVFECAEHVDFWACDACALPFADASFSLAVSLNVLDCVGTPYDHLKELARILRHNAGAVISTPYDWSANATPVASWLGGHSQRSENRGSSETILRSLLAGGAHPHAIQELAIASEVESMPWTMRLHDRSFMEYPVHMITVRKK